MNKVLSLLAATVAFATSPALAQGDPSTVARGFYLCEMPGDAGTAVGLEQPEESFSIISASRYSSMQGEGIYLRRGDRLIMTSGPRNGDTYQIVRRGFLRKIVDDAPSRLRCIRQAR